jgi:1-deoxy-D-xylulose-5-phosphate reductoisomerase
MAVVTAVVLLGSTGSIGTQTLDVVAAAGDRFRVTGLAAGGADPGLLARQVLAHAETVEVVAVGRATALEDVTLALYAEAERRGYRAGQWRLPRLLAGPDAMTEIAVAPSDILVNGMPGSAGLAPTLAALRAGRRVALANKESLVAGGPLVRALLAELGTTMAERVVPVDSEHSALAQCLRGGRAEEVRRLILTASGGPFRGWSREQLAGATRDQALAHPTWQMGPLVTINSATLVNKGLETIEAHELFGLDYDRIDTVVHAQSVIHSMVEFVDGSTLAQLSPPDMKLPISLALGWPDRVPDAAAGLDLTRAAELTFAPLDTVAFPAVELAKAAGRAGGTAPAVFNAANEQAVAGFLAGSRSLLSIVETIERVLAEHTPVEPRDLADVAEVDAWARARADELVAAAAGGVRA